MGAIFKFFLNALKAIVFSPFYLAYFALYLIYCLLHYLFAGIRNIFTRGKYRSIEYNKYQMKLNELKGQNGE